MTDEVGFSVGAVARRLGVAPSTLRTWNRRYGIGAHEFSPGRHRRAGNERVPAGLLGERGTVSPAGS